MTETSVAYKQNTVTVELENEAIIKTETIVVDSPTPDAKIVTITAEPPVKDAKGVVIVAVALGVIILIIVGLCFKKFALRQKQQVIELEEQIKRAKNVVEPKDPSKDLNVLVAAQAKQNYNMVNRDSIMPEDVIQYEPQYDPNNDFKIFGVGDQKTGGIQDMKEKMNMADAKEQDSSSESEIDTNRDANQPMGVKQYNQAQHMAKETVLEGSSSQEGLTVGGSTGGKSSENLHNNNDLPENKEIHSSSEEDN